MKTKGNLVVISGPSGAGKDTICRAVLAAMPGLHLSISATTRTPRRGEQNGVDYYFLNQAQFKELIAEDQLLEWAEVYGNYYGTLRAPVDEALHRGQDVVLEIDVQGALEVKRNYPDSVLIFLMPPSRGELEKRLLLRGTETPEAIKQRLDWLEKEIVQVIKYDYLVINNQVTDAAQKVVAIITAEGCRPKLLDLDTFLQQYW